MKILIKDPLILKYNEGRFYAERSHILIEDDKIADLTNEIPKELSDFDEVIQASHLLALPGLINTHNHSPMSLLRSFSDDLR